MRPAPLPRPLCAGPQGTGCGFLPSMVLPGWGEQTRIIREQWTWERLFFLVEKAPGWVGQWAGAGLLWGQI